MATKMSMAILFVVLTAVLHVTEAATSYVVGNATAWSVPTSTNFYTTWAEQYNFTVGDTLGNLLPYMYKKPNSIALFIYFFIKFIGI
jgi:hypothetical protein